MDKQAQIEGLARLILIRMGWAGSRLLDAKETAEAIWDNDYRKVEKMPVLTDEMLFRVAFDREPDPGEIDPEEKFDFYDAYRSAAQAQRDADWKAMRGEE